LAELNCGTGCPFYDLEENQEILEDFLAEDLSEKVDVEQAIAYFSELICDLDHSEKCTKCATFRSRSDFLGK